MSLFSNLQRLLGLGGPTRAQQPRQAAPVQQQALSAQSATPYQRLLHVAGPGSGFESENSVSPFGPGNPDGTDYSNINPFDLDQMYGIGVVQPQSSWALPQSPANPNFVRGQRIQPPGYPYNPYLD